MFLSSRLNCGWRAPNFRYSLLIADLASREPLSSSAFHHSSTALQRTEMEQSTGLQSWVHVPQHRQWGFEEPRPELLKVVIDLRPKEQQPLFHPPPEREYGSSLSSMLAHYQQAKVSGSSCSGPHSIFIAYSQQNVQVGGQQSGGSYVPELFVCLLTHAHCVFIKY